MHRFLSLFFATLLLLSACKKDKSTTIGGDTDIPLNTIGNTFGTTVNINGEYFDPNEDITLISNDNGVITLKVKANLPPGNPLADLIPAEYKDAEGNLDCNIRFTNTSEGIMDYFNLDQESFVLVRYDAKVGDTYKLKKSNGVTITREVTYKSTDDDFPYGFMYIKVIDVEQDSRIPGVSKIVYHTNHKFGLAGVEIFMEDGTSSSMLIYPMDY